MFFFLGFSKVFVFFLGFSKLFLAILLGFMSFWGERLRSLLGFLLPQLTFKLCSSWLSH